MRQSKRFIRDVDQWVRRWRWVGNGELTLVRWAPHYIPKWWFFKELTGGHVTYEYSGHKKKFWIVGPKWGPQYAADGLLISLRSWMADVDEEEED